MDEAWSFERVGQVIGELGLIGWFCCGATGDQRENAEANGESELAAWCESDSEHRAHFYLRRISGGVPVKFSFAPVSCWTSSAVHCGATSRSTKPFFVTSITARSVTIVVTQRNPVSG